jgi:hypothetical protein
MQKVRFALRAVAGTSLPPSLHQKLRVMASHEHARRVSRLDMAARMNHLRQRLRLMFDNIMRPFGLPVASGLVSAVLLFALLAPSLSFARHGGIDNPTDLATDPELTKVSATRDGPRIEDPDSVDSKYQTVLELQISPEGKVWNWNVMQGTLTPELKQMILFSRFQPATVFGQPTWGEVIVYFRHESRYIVRG